MDDTSVDQAFALDLTLHPDYKAGVHPYVVIFGTAHVISQLEFGRSSMDV